MCKSKYDNLKVWLGVFGRPTYIWATQTKRFQKLSLPHYMTTCTTLKFAVSIRHSWRELRTLDSSDFEYATIPTKKLTSPEGHPGGAEHHVWSLNEVSYQKIRSALLATSSLQQSFHSDWNQSNNAPISLCWCMSPSLPDMRGLQPWGKWVV